jgi:hypothetical protein
VKIAGKSIKKSMKNDRKNRKRQKINPKNLKKSKKKNRDFGKKFVALQISLFYLLNLFLALKKKAKNGRKTRNYGN